MGLGPMNHQLLVEASIVVLTSIKFRLWNFHLGYSNDKSKRFSSKTPQINPNKLLLNITTPSTFLNILWLKFASSLKALYRPRLEKVQFWLLLLPKKLIRSNNVSPHGVGVEHWPCNARVSGSIPGEVVYLDENSWTHTKIIKLSFRWTSG